jgi:geranylgeranyl diphosphate synthase, type II
MEIKKYQQLVNAYITNKYLPTKNASINEMIKWSLNGGKRLRSMIVLDIFNSLQKSDQIYDFPYELAMANELIHSSCLILDDMPCMDNDNYRRDQQSFHKQYNEANAVIISSYLITDAYRCIENQITYLRSINNNDNNDNNNNMLSNSDITKIQLHLTSALARNTNEASIGQFMDLFPLKSNTNFNTYTKDQITDIITKKTAPFFEMSFLTTYIYTMRIQKKPVLREKLDKVIELASLFGFLFQVSDDFTDVETDKQKNNVLNYVILFGRDCALKEFNEKLARFITKMKHMSMYSKLFQELVVYLQKRITYE